MLWVASYALLVVAAALNRRIAGVPVVAAGMLLNLVAILANRGTMPVSYEAMHGAGRSGRHPGQLDCDVRSEPAVARRPLGGAGLAPARERLLRR